MKLSDHFTASKVQPWAPRIWRVALKVVVTLMLTLVLVEVALRFKQVFGPLYDLDVNAEAAAYGLSDELNHTLPPSQTEWDADGIRRMRVPNSAQCAPKLLFLGDSFIQGLGIDDTIPVHVRAYFHDVMHREVCAVNAGTSS